MHVAMETITECLRFTNHGINYRPLQLLCYCSGKRAAFSPLKRVMTAINSKRIFGSLCESRSGMLWSSPQSCHNEISHYWIVLIAAFKVTVNGYVPN